MSLVEVLVAVGLLGGLVLGINTLATKVLGEYWSVSERITQEQATHDIAFYLKHYLSLAVELSDIGAGGTFGGDVSNKDGRIKEFNLDSWTATAGPGSATPIALFFMESLKSGATVVPGQTDRYLPVGVFFTAPTTDRYGVIGIDLGQRNSFTISGRSLDYRFTHIVDFKIRDIVFDRGADGRNKVRSFLLGFTTRSYKAGTANDYKWCPPSKMNHPACMTTSAYRDIQKTVEVVVRNNALGLSNSRRWRPPASPIYTEPDARRAIEGVYFLRPDVPVDALRR